MLMKKKIQYFQDISSSLLDILIRSNPNPNPNGLLCRYGKPDATVYVESQKTQSSQDDAEGEELGWRTDAAWLQDFLQSYSKQDGVVLAKD